MVDHDGLLRDLASIQPQAGGCDHVAEGTLDDVLVGHSRLRSLLVANPRVDSGQAGLVEQVQSTKGVHHREEGFDCSYLHEYVCRRRRLGVLFVDGGVLSGSRGSFIPLFPTLITSNVYSRISRW